MSDIIRVIDRNNKKAKVKATIELNYGNVALTKLLCDLFDVKVAGKIPYQNGTIRCQLSSFTELFGMAEDNVEMCETQLKDMSMAQLRWMSTNYDDIPEDEFEKNLQNNVKMDLEEHFYRVQMFAGFKITQRGWNDADIEIQFNDEALKFISNIEDVTFETKEWGL